jgi:hypothetical protein
VWLKQKLDSRIPREFSMVLGLVAVTVDPVIDRFFCVVSGGFGNPF